VSYTASVLRLLASARIKLDPGLSNTELDEVERRFTIRFPPDLRELLAAALPVDLGFPNWRTGQQHHKNWDGSIEVRSLDDVLTDPLEGILFDAEHGFWPEWWTPRPDSLEDRKREIKRRIRAAAPLIPVYGHRYIPSDPSEPGNPVLSVHQSDIIYYGSNLEDYFYNEFTKRPFAIKLTDTRQVPFWTDFVL
jgi:hypothetical protein